MTELKMSRTPKDVIFARFYESLSLLRVLIDPDPCSYDHHGLCQAHGLAPRPCPHEAAKSFLAEAEAEDGGRNGKRPAKRGGKKRPRKTTAKTTAKVEPAVLPVEEPKERLPVGALIPQDHGGALRNGGTNAGGPGRPPAAIRALARGGFERRVPTLETIADDQEAKDSDRIRAIDVLGKYGMGHPVSIDDVREAWRQQIDEIRDFLPPEQSEVLLARLKPIWQDL